MELFSGTYSYSSEEADFMSHLFGSFSTTLPNFQDSSAFWQHHDSASLSISDNANANMPVFSLENSCTEGSNVTFPTSSGESDFSLSCSQKGISVIPFIRAAKPSPDVHTSWKKPKFNKSQKTVSKVNVGGVDHDVARLNTNGKKRGSAIDSQSVYAKLLSSDDLWMYAPLAYNGLDLALPAKLPSPRR